ncbi:DUF4132 domain-containing protein [Dictyobacter kobayashii]|uniref:DUF4132 domain-containing protein n=1 Tax=Dictyobacter kobayashii TaxID=2014872 RepID=A0A402AIC1_9CHLR|nr:DUF4132 domain-containing protein [Dictyobacter kobayashii]GCE18794.1 hypothetical protein KDK_25940 [Dictyobacter kobayashii]
MTNGGKVEVRSRIFQATTPDSALPTVILDILNEEITVTELIRRTVTEQIRELVATRKLDAQQAQQALQRQYLTDAEIHDQAKKGKVIFAQNEATRLENQNQDIQVENEIRKATNAFEQRAYVIIADGKMISSLDEKLLFHPGSTITFFRLIPLIGDKLMNESEARELAERFSAVTMRFSSALNQLGQKLVIKHTIAERDRLRENLVSLTIPELVMLYRMEEFQDLLESSILQQKQEKLRARVENGQLPAQLFQFLELILSCIAIILNEKKYQAFGFSEAPGWLMLRLSRQPFQKILKTTLETFTNNFSVQEIGSMATTLYFQPQLWWERAQTLPEIQLQACMRTVLNACVIHYAPTNLTEQLEQRIIQLVKNTKTGNTEDCYFSIENDLGDCLQLFIALPYSERSLSILDATQSLIYHGEYYNTSFKYKINTIARDSIKKPIDILRKNDALDEDILSLAVILAPYDITHQFSSDHPYIKQIFTRFASDLKPQTGAALASSTEYIHGKEYLLYAAQQHQQHNLGPIVDNIDQSNKLKAAIVSMAHTDGIAELNPTERKDLLLQLKTYPETTLTALLPLAPQAQNLIIEALEWQEALPLLELIKRLTNVQYTAMNDNYATDMPNSLDPTSGEIDIAEINTIIEQVGRPLAKKMVKCFQTARVFDHTCLMISASQGWESQLEKKLKIGSQIAIKAYGIAPITRGKEEILERYLKLQEAAKLGKKYGPQRRVSHKAAIEVGLSNLAKTAGYPEVNFLEWDMETQISNNEDQHSHNWQIGDYLLEIQVKDLIPTLNVTRGSRQYKTIPKEIREHPTYQIAKEKVRVQREQISRLRNHYLEQLIGSERLLDPNELSQIIQLPIARSLFEGLILGTEDGQTGIFDAQHFALRDLQNELQPITRAVKVVHPYSLFQAGTLSAWQRTIVQRQIVQPIKQAFRELYVLTPAEQASSPYSRRFAGHSIAGHITSKLLSSRDWRQEQSYGAITPYKIFPGIKATFNLLETGPYLGAHLNPITDCIYFAPYPASKRADLIERNLDLNEVPPLIFSEVMRDADLIISVAHTQRDGSHSFSNEFYTRRHELIETLFADLNLPGVTVEGHFAHIQGKLARYRIHLLTAAIHIEPGNYLCIVPQNWGQKTSSLFLPFANEDDPKLSEVISKILLLLADDQIKDESILQQIRNQQA